jgi:hypothetical protein
MINEAETIAARGQAPFGSAGVPGNPPHASWRAIHSSTTGAIRSRHLLPLKMP